MRCKQIPRQIRIRLSDRRNLRGDFQTCLKLTISARCTVCCFVNKQLSTRIRVSNDITSQRFVWIWLRQRNLSTKKGKINMRNRLSQPANAANTSQQSQLLETGSLLGAAVGEQRARHRAMATANAAMRLHGLRAKKITKLWVCTGQCSSWIGTADTKTRLNDAWTYTWKVALQPGKSW